MLRFRCQCPAICTDKLNEQQYKKHRKGYVRSLLSSLGVVGEKKSNMKRLVTLLLLTIVADAAPVEDLITSLPNVDFFPNFRQYSGYLKVPNEERYLHYW